MDNNDEFLVGGNAFEEMLKSVNVDRELRRLVEEVKSIKSVSKRDATVKRIKYLAGLQKNNIKPHEGFILHNMPVLPPIARPVINRGGNELEFADIDNLYKDHFLVARGLKDLDPDLGPEHQTNIEIRKAYYDGAKAIMGLGDAISGQSRGQKHKGLLRQIGGTLGPKSGMFHDRILKKKQDFSGRATIYAEPSIGFNEVAAPKDMLWSLYKFHILRDLSKTGYNYVDSVKAWGERNMAATTSFNRVIKQVPLILNRPPTLMKSNMTAHFPVPIEGSTLGINPLHLPLYAGDYDGDALTVHVPMTPEAVEEAKKQLLPQNQIYDYRRGQGNSLIMPGHEAIVGSLHMTEPDMNQKPHEFKTEALALEALKKGEILENTPIKITG